MDGSVKRFHILYHSKDKRQYLKSCGVNLFKPMVFDYIYDNSYMDIKEQLIPLLNRNGISVLVYEIKDSITNVNTFIDYFI